MKKSIKKELNKYLKELSKKELEDEIKKMYDKFKEVKKYYEIELCDDTTEILNEYKERLKAEYFPKRGYGKARSSESRKIVNAFKKISIFKKDVIELLLWRVKMMVEYTKAYGDINEAFYNSLESSYDEACRLISQEKLEEKYKDNCMDLMDETYNFGWGLYDGMKTIYDSNIEKIKYDYKRTNTDR